MSEIDPDRSASTARFRAFTQRPDEELPAPWKMRVPASRVGVLVAVVAVVAVVAALIGLAVAG